MGYDILETATSAAHTARPHSFLISIQEVDPPRLTMLSLDQQNAYRQAYRRANPGWQPATERFAGLVRSQLKAESRVLDLGCGRGGLVEQLDHPLNQVTGVDPDYLSLREHRLGNRHPPLPRVVTLSHAMPFADDSFDLVYASWVLEHLARPAADFGEIARVLRPGGRFIFVTPNKGHPLITFNRLIGRAAGLQRRFVERFYGRAGADTFPAYYRANSITNLRSLAGQAGLESVQLIPVEDPSYLAFNPTFFRASCWLSSHLPPNRRIHLVGEWRLGIRDQEAGRKE